MVKPLPLTRGIGSPSIINLVLGLRILRGIVIFIKFVVLNLNNMNTIRKISVGLNYPDGALHYQVGRTQNLGGLSYEIKSIKHYFNDNGSCYDIIIHNPKDESNVVWKTIQNLPVVVEFLVDFE